MQCDYLNEYCAHINLKKLNRELLDKYFYSICHINNTIKLQLNQIIIFITDHQVLLS